MAKYLDIELIVLDSCLVIATFFNSSTCASKSVMSLVSSKTFNTVKMSFKGVLRLVVIVCAS